MKKSNLPMWIRQPVMFARIVRRYLIAGGRMGLVCIVRGHHDKSPPKGECNVCDFVWTQIQMEYDAKLKRERECSPWSD